MPATPHMTPIQGPDTWKAADFKEPRTWVEHYTEHEIEEIEQAVQRFTARFDGFEAITREDVQMPLLQAKLERIRNEIEGGKGFQVLRGLPVARYTIRQCEQLFWALSLLVGEPEAQDKSGSRLHSVYNKGKKLTDDHSARGYETDNELTFHNDGGDAFMLLCIKTAVSGGVSKLVSVNQVFNQILKRAPHLAATLQQPYYFDARGQHPAGHEVQCVPVFNYFEGKLSALYKRDYLDMAQRFDHVPRLTGDQIAALDLLDEICSEPDMQLSFMMEPGDIQIGNNYSIFHSRTKYEDHEKPEDKRRLLRTWLTLPNGRALPAAFADTREFCHSYRARHAAATA
ncbi:TauD/TfdA family dioxygenase [Achromobacter sp. DMS1]|uniref:TauD/TfdA family dioxygenase n=1 Tax=Achromobacter sp. DMS1 TaxID=1688405 RepID=UPI000AD804FC|nr:TauD/TfdA family dioxygenase [Achromobacter sp. DMS1]